MFVLTEEEYNRLKLKLENIPTQRQQQQQQYGPDHTVTAAANTANVENTPTAHDLHEPLPPPPQQITSTTLRYSCPICGKSYKRKRDLMQHVKLRHGIIPPTRAIIPPSAIVIEKKKKQKKKKKKTTRMTTSIHVFDKVKKWMTIRG